MSQNKSDETNVLSFSAMGTMEQSISTQAKAMIQQSYPKAVTFDPTWLMVVTWEKMDFYSSWWWWYYYGGSSASQVNVWRRLWS